MTVRALVVDDVADLRGLVRSALRLRGGFEVVGEAADGETAVEVAASAAPDVIVLDLALPHLAGKELIARLRQVAPQAKIVVFTGAAESVEAIGAPVEGFVRKSEDVRTLVDRLVALTAVPLESASIHLPGEAESAGVGRAFLREHAAAWGCAEVLDSALVVVSELVTNAVVHAEGGCTLTLRHQSGRLRIEVLDTGEGSPDPHLAGDDEEHGRGLVLVSVLTDAWGVEPGATGKVVWAELGVLPEM